MAVSFQKPTPLLRIFNVEKAKEWFFDFLGFAVDWELHLDASAPAYLQVSRDQLLLRLTEHHDVHCQAFPKSELCRSCGNEKDDRLGEIIR